jgi:hypothetical protein
LVTEVAWGLNQSPTKVVFPNTIDLNQKTAG